MINGNKQRKTIEWERRDLFKKMRDSKGIFHAQMGTVKDKNNMDLTEDIKQEVARIHRRTIQKRS